MAFAGRPFPCRDGPRSGGNGCPDQVVKVERSDHSHSMGLGSLFQWNTGDFRLSTRSAALVSGVPTGEFLRLPRFLFLVVHAARFMKSDRWRSQGDLPWCDRFDRQVSRRLNQPFIDRPRSWRLRLSRVRALPLFGAAPGPCDEHPGPLPASKATRAANSGVKFLRVFSFLVLGPNPPGMLPLSIRESEQDPGSVRRGHPRQEQDPGNWIRSLI
jgi:hypothetical protein